jgi:hypothetical protein
MAFNNPTANPQNRNVPIHSEVIVPLEKLVHTSILSKRISKKKIEELAAQKYRTCGKGIDFCDVMEFHCSKVKAQRMLRNCCLQKIGKVVSLHAPIIFRSPRRTSPQCYYPSILRADILEKLKQRDNLTDITTIRNVPLHFHKLYYLVK